MPLTYGNGIEITEYIATNGHCVSWELWVPGCEKESLSFALNVARSWRRNITRALNVLTAGGHLVQAPLVLTVRATTAVRG